MVDHGKTSVEPENENTESEIEQTHELDTYQQPVKETEL